VFSLARKTFSPNLWRARDADVISDLDMVWLSTKTSIEYAVYVMVSQCM
jgi:hypothetical protein